MKITICGSMFAAKEMLRIQSELQKMGHEVSVPKSIIEHSVVSSDDAQRFRSDRTKYLNELKPYYTRDHFRLVENSDAILVVNVEKNGIKNYIGGATFSEIMLAFHLNKKIFFLNPIPNDERTAILKDELEAVKSVILDGNLKKLQ